SPVELGRALAEAAASPLPTTRSAVPPTQRQAPVVPVPPAKSNRTPLVIAGAAVALAAAAVLVVVLSTSGGPTPTPNPTPRVGETPERPTAGRPDTAEQARQALNLLRSNQIASLLRAGSYRQAIRAIEDFERSYPQVASDIAVVCADIFSRAQREYEDLRMAALARRDAGLPAEGAAMLREARPRFVGISDLEARLDSLATEMDAAGGGRPAPSGDILSVAKGQLAAAKEMYKRGDETDSAPLLEEAGFKAEEARVKFQALVDVVSGLQAEEVRAKLRETIQLVKLINDARKRTGGKPAEPTPTTPPVVKGPTPEPEPAPTHEPPPEVKPPPPAEKPGEKEAAALFTEAAQASKEGKNDKALEACRKLLKDFGTTDFAAAKRAEIETLAKTAAEELEKDAARELSKGVKDGRFHLGKHEYPEAQGIFAPLKEKYSAYEAYKKHDKEIEKALERCAEEIAWAEKALVTGSEDPDDWSSGWGGEVRISGTDKAAKGKGAVKLRINPAQPRYDEPGVFPGAGTDMPKEMPGDAVAVSVWLKAEGKAANVDIELWLGEGTMQRTFYATVSLSSAWKEYKVLFSGLRPRYFTREVQYSGGPKFDVRDVRRIVLSNSTSSVTIEFSVDEVRFVKR
ncbi:MAG TPA: hypothetical protein VI643_04885, partial [Planctomycetota bacterium]|nr:hypothetical protein [Planctomycetota bacterium]